MTTVFEPGNYRYAPGPFQYSAGVAAEPGFMIERARFAESLPLEEGFRAIERRLAAAGRPLTAFCACELRSPAPFTERGFAQFNRVYAETLERWGLLADGNNPVARSNVCPEIDPPPTPSFHAFCYTVPASGDIPGFVVAGSAEAPEGRGNYRDHIVRRGEIAPDALREKARFVLNAMEARMEALEVDWRRATATQVYTVHDIYPLLADDIVARGAAGGGLVWHYARPPVEGLEYEMDVRGVPVERVVRP